MVSMCDQLLENILTEMVECVIVEAKFEYFTTVFHHGDKFVYTLNMRYSRRRVSYFNLCHVEAMSMIEINDMI